MQQTNNMIDSVHNLEHAGMNRAQAEALTKLIRDSVAEAVQHLATKAELAELGAQVSEVKNELTKLRNAHDAQVEHTNAQIALIRAELTTVRGELTEKMGINLRYMAFSTGFSTIAIVTALFAVFFATPTVG